MKVSIALVSVFFLLGCVHRQIQCTNSDGQITYTGPYDVEGGGSFIVEVNSRTRDFYSKASCRKV